MSEVCAPMPSRTERAFVPIGSNAMCARATDRSIVIRMLCPELDFELAAFALVTDCRRDLFRELRHDPDFKELE